MGDDSTEGLTRRRLFKSLFIAALGTLSNVAPSGVSRAEEEALGSTKSPLRTGAKAPLTDRKRRRGATAEKAPYPVDLDAAAHKLLDDSEVWRLAATLPKTAMIESWHRVQVALLRLAARQEVPPTYRAALAMVYRLAERSRLDRSTADLIVERLRLEQAGDHFLVRCQAHSRMRERCHLPMKQPATRLRRRSAPSVRMLQDPINFRANNLLAKCRSSRHLLPYRLRAPLPP